MMMFTTKRAVAALAATAALAMGLSGCSNPAANTSGSDTDTSAADYWPEATGNRLFRFSCV